MMVKKTFLTVILSLVFVLTTFSGVFAQTSPASVQADCKIENDREVCRLENPIGVGQQGTTSATAIIGLVIKTALGIIGALTLFMLVWGGFQWLTSAGNSEKVESGTKTMVWAVIGVALVFFSYLLLSTFTNYLTGKV